MEAFRLFQSTREWITPVLTESAFLERGVLTPEEFVRSGDHLVACCPSWEWCEGEPSKVKTYLPKEKQFLITRGVPSYHRVATLFAATVMGNSIEGDGGEDWEAPILQSREDLEREEEGVLIGADDLDLKPSADGSVVSPKMAQSVASPAPIDEYADMEDESLALDDATVSAAPSGTHSSSNHLVRARRYDLSITYDKYYQTPRSWLFGYDENGAPLPSEAIFQDFMQDYVKKTVTIEPHPHVSRPHASVHPCQHGAAMKRIIDDLTECGKVPNVDQYMFIFLKFIQSIVPTIEYDYTMDVDARGA